MLGAGMALYSGMEALEKTYENDPHAQLYQAISSGVVETGSLHDALEATHAFPRYMVEMCGIGEQTPPGRGSWHRPKRPFCGTCVRWWF